MGMSLVCLKNWPKIQLLSQKIDTFLGEKGVSPNFGITPETERLEPKIHQALKRKLTDSKFQASITLGSKFCPAKKYASQS